MSVEAEFIVESDSEALKVVLSSDLIRNIRQYSKRRQSVRVWEGST